MSGFHKNKGIVIELTALLDVIMIMLFWLVMNMSESTDKAEKKAQAEIESASSQIEVEKKKAQEEIDSILDDTSRQIAEAQEKAENINSSAAANQEALDGYEQGLLVTLMMKSESDGDKLYIKRGDDEVSSFSIESTDCEQALTDALKSLELEEDDVVLCALVYDGNSVLDKNFNKLNSAIEKIHLDYKKLYCTYINTNN